MHTGGICVWVVSSDRHSTTLVFFLFGGVGAIIPVVVNSFGVYCCFAPHISYILYLLIGGTIRDTTLILETNQNYPLDLPIGFLQPWDCIWQEVHPLYPTSHVKSSSTGCKRGKQKKQGPLDQTRDLLFYPTLMSPPLGLSLLPKKIN